MADRGFARQEHKERLSHVQVGMARQDLAGLLLCSAPEIRYFTGFFTPFWQSPTRPWFLFLPVEGAPVAVIPDIGVGLMAKTIVSDIRSWPAPNPDDDGLSLLRDVLHPLAKRRQRLGLLKGPETSLRMPLGDFEKLMAGLPGLQIADATGLIAGLRMVKSEAEIAKIRHCCAALDRSFAQIPDVVQPGMSLADLFREFRRTALAQGVDDMPYLVGDAGRNGYKSVIAPPSAQPLTARDVFMLDTGATWDGYFCDFDRNFALSSADILSRDAHRALWDATEAGLDAARPGATCRSVFEAMQAVIAQIDPNEGQIGRFGHGLGMQLTEWPSVAPFDTTVLQENMVLTLEPSLSYGDGRIMVQEENIVIRKDGPELLTQRAPRELPIISGAWQ